MPFILIVSAPLSPGQLPDAGQRILEIRVAHFELKDQTLFDGLAQLSSSVKSLAFGFEKFLTAKFTDPDVSYPHFSIDLADKTVREILNELCKMDSRYTWSRDGRTINVYPRATVDDPSYLLNRRLEKLALSGVTDIQQPLLAIYQQLPQPRENIGIVQAGGDITYPSKPWTVTLANLTVRQAMNRIAAHMGPRGSWILSGSRDVKAFSFQKWAFEGLSSH